MTFWDFADNHIFAIVICMFFICSALANILKPTIDNYYTNKKENKDEKH